MKTTMFLFINLFFIFNQLFSFAQLSNDESKNDSANIKIQKYAVVIGVSEQKYSDKNITPRKYAAADARSFYDFLISPKWCGFSKSNINLILNKNATKKNIESAINDFLGKAMKNDIVVLYIAGFVNPEFEQNGKLYFYAYDSNPDNIESSGINIADFKLTGNISKNIYIFADANNSFGIFEFSPRKGVDEWETLNNRKKYLDNRTVMASSYKNRPSIEGKKWGGHGVFTYYLIKALKGEVDEVNLNKKEGLLQLKDIEGYIRNCIIKETEKQQIPYFMYANENADSTVLFLK